ncbi:MAG: endonuclease NucS domain-containing protein [Hoeflea sp.]|uniref:endonuclease NucS domain-containing protein n=1 Tax=Hoeflea sp. TaxID=1940281 RepID=UPI003299A5EC
MLWYTEKLLEDCIAAAPEAFLGEPLRLKAQQYRIGGFVPDLIFNDDKESIVIVEVQKNALDRMHLYKCLEYRDLLKDKSEGVNVRVLLVCESISKNHESIIKTHSIEFFAISADELLEKAMVHSRSVLINHLVSGFSQIVSDAPKNKQSYELRPYLWSRYDNILDVYTFIMKEIDRAGISESIAKNSDFNELLDLARETRTRGSSFSNILDPSRWRIDALFFEPSGWIPPEHQSLTRIRKPKITVSIIATSKGNLSVRWFPETRDRSGHSIDWIASPSTQSYGYERPENEILFVRSIDKYDPRNNYSNYYADFEMRESLNSMFIGLVCALIESVFLDISRVVDVVDRDTFRIIKGTEHADGFISKRYEVKGWEICSAEQIKVEISQARIDKFFEEYPVSLEDIFVRIEAQGLGLGERAYSLLAKDLRSDGLKITVKHVRELFTDLEVVKNERTLRLLYARK